MGKIYDKLHNWLFPIDEYERDIVPVSSYHDYSPSPFQKMMLNYLAWNGIDKKGNVTNNKVFPTLAEIQKNRTTLRECGFAGSENIEKLIISEFLEMKRSIPDLNPVIFANFYEDKYHNLKPTQFTTLETQKSNKITKEHYDTIKSFSTEIKDCLQAVDLRIRIECIHTENKNWFNHTRVRKFITPFCKLALYCDKLGRFSITYFINPHFKELVGELLGNTLEKQFDKLANYEIKDLVKMTPLNRRYDKWFKQIQSIPNYKVTVTEQNLL